MLLSCLFPFACSTSKHDSRYLIPMKKEFHLKAHRLLFTDFSASIFPLHPAPKTDLLIPYELPEHPNPAFVVRQVSIEFLGNLMQYW